MKRHDDVIMAFSMGASMMFLFGVPTRKQLRKCRRDLDQLRRETSNGDTTGE